MLRSQFEFACVLNLIYLSFISSASFGDFCSNDSYCSYPLICSNSSSCICPLSPAESFWNSTEKTCLFCPKGWIGWQNETCLLFTKPPKRGITYEKAKLACSRNSARLLTFQNDQNYIEFQYKINELMNGDHAKELDEFLIDGFWINLVDNMTLMNTQEQCATIHDNEQTSIARCIHLKKRLSTGNSSSSLCLRHVQCNESLSFICEKLADLESAQNEANRIFGLIGGIFNSIFSPPKPPPPVVPPIQQPPPEPIIIYQTNPPNVGVPEALQAKSNNTWLYIGIAAAVGFIILIILLCCCFGGGLFLLKDSKNTRPSVAPPRASRFSRRYYRSSADSTASGASY